MTATVVRDTEDGTDPDGHPILGSPSEHTVACWLFVPSARAELSNDDVNVVVNELRLLVDYDADVTEQDEIDGVINADGSTVDARRFRITFDRRRGDGRIGISHRALTLEAIT